MVLSGFLFFPGVYAYVVPFAFRQAPTVAYTVPAAKAGNQAYTGTLGMDFNVGTVPITVMQVGYFAPSGAIPPSGTTITVGIFNRATSTLVSGTQLTFTNASPGSNVSGTTIYMKFLSAPVVLPASGTYSIVALGYSASYLNGNTGTGFSTGNTRGGKITFTGTSRYGGTTFVYPTTIDVNVMQYGAGSFSFY